MEDIKGSCDTCYYSGGGKHSCDRHLNKLKPDYTKGIECAYNNYAHYRSFDVIMENLRIEPLDTFPTHT